jgi:rhomboid family GlyGly-CTERM serine protease
MNQFVAVKPMTGVAWPRLPWVTIALTCIALIAQCDSGIAGALEYQRDTIAGGQLWRLITGHFAHWTAAQFGCDALAFFVLGTAVEIIVGWRWLLMVALLSAGAISGGIWIAKPDVAVYRGLSGIASALLVALGVLLLRRGTQDRDRPAALAAATLLLAIALKTAMEAVTGSPLIVSEDEAFRPILLTHWLGSACGLGVSLLWQWKR